MAATEQARWFAEEVQPHEAALRAYLSARFPTLRDYDDLIQETYSRLLRARACGHVRYPRAFLFTTARNAALDQFRRWRVVRHEVVTEENEAVALDSPQALPDAIARQQELDLLAEAVRSLPERCREVVMLRYLDGMAYKEIAQQLGISPETVKVHLAKGMRRCADFFESRGLCKNDSGTGAHST